jgi:hypothetical protein
MEFYFGLNIAADQIVKDERKYWLRHKQQLKKRLFVE